MILLRAPQRVRDTATMGLLFLALVGVVGIAIGASFNANQVSLVLQRESILRATALAESGVALAREALRSDRHYRGTDGNWLTLYQDPAQQQLPLGSFMVTVTPLGEKQVRVVSQGRHTNSAIVSRSVIISFER